MGRQDRVTCIAWLLHISRCARENQRVLKEYHGEKEKSKRLRDKI